MQRVVGIGIDGTCVSIIIGRTTIPCVKASYADSLDPAFLAPMGSQERGEKTPGTYKCDDTKITMSSVIFRTILMPAMPVTGAGNVQYPIIVQREHPDLGDDSDLLVNCSFMGWTAAVENSSKAEEVELALSTGQIKWTDRRVCINRIEGVAATVGTL